MRVYVIFLFALLRVTQVRVVFGIQEYIYMPCANEKLQTRDENIKSIGMLLDAYPDLKIQFEEDHTLGLDCGFSCQRIKAQIV